MSKKVLRVATPDGLRADLATVTLTGERVRVHYHSPEIRREWERSGIFVSGVGEVRPTDGRPFFDALERAYSRSSTHFVEMISDDR